MTALSDALEQARTRALAVLSKSYMAPNYEAKDDELRVALDNMGLTDKVEQTQWLYTLSVIRSHGGEAPAETNGKPKEPPATEAQLAFISKLLAEKSIAPDDFPDAPLTKADAHAIIDSLQSGSYDPAKWKLPF